MSKISILTKKVFILTLFSTCFFSNFSCGKANSQTSAATIADSLNENASDAAAPAKTVLDTLTFSFVGDVMPGTTFPESPKGAYLPANGGKNLFDDARVYLQRADLAFGNLEGSMTEGGTPGKKCSNPNTCYIFRIPTSMAQVLADEGFDLMNMANNHSHDFGVNGINSSLKALDEVGIKAAGIKDVMPTAIVEKDGVKIGLIGFSTSGKGIPATQYEAAKELIKNLSKQVDITVVSLHAGAEGLQYDRVPRKEEFFLGENRGDVYKFAHNAIDAGADIVWGHGPHVPRGMELYKDKLIMYSLGNFCTPYRMNLKSDTGLAPLVEVKVDSKGNFIDGNIHSFRQQTGVGPRNDSSNEAARKIMNLSTKDFPESSLKISADGKMSK
ncbi:MAG: CapA family protein [Muribaculaceae bacterium]|nr:CapA family protein [Muribaculaceae bacterium]